ncbi:NmrA family NAD(P)-binding protein [Amycolatopsis sp. CA-128772]|uniref:NmrA family NAD(P)-binding protein n=1 Tax=Amycolatopsis sp. CA-128772 TaxID=2073159 RepID=UPI000CD15144|nr:NmrA family NAD(P)-binding protein [Amycolatopsis sp. CA-128772]
MFPVTGATGNVGAEVVAALAVAGAPVRALVRRPDAVLPDGAEAAVPASVLGRELREASLPREYVEAFWSFYADGTLDEATVFPTVPEVTGRPARTFAEWAEAHADAFR